MQEKVRVYALARELNIESKDLLEICKKVGFDVKNQLSSLEPDQRDVVVEMIKKGSHKQPAPPPKPVVNPVPAIAGRVPTLHAPRPRIKEPSASNSTSPPGCRPRASALPLRLYLSRCPPQPELRKSAQPLWPLPRRRLSKCRRWLHQRPSW